MMNEIPKPFIWSDKSIEFLIKNYPIYGKIWCAEKLRLKEHHIRYKASQLKLVAKGVSEAWKKKQIDHSILLIGRKRPEQILVINKTRSDGKLKVTDAMKLNMSEKTKKRILEKGHPRGMLGIKHTDEAKEKMSVSGKLTWANKSPEERDKYSLRSAILGRKATMNRANASWKSGWREFGGKRNYYRSRWEANYGMYLQWLKENGQILGWEHEPEIFWFEGIKRGCMSYLPDFRVIELDGSIVFHEVKGWMDDRSKTKINRMRIYHPKVKLIVIESKGYKAIEKKARFLITGWES
jgi:hypothetical protein